MLATFTEDHLTPLTFEQAAAAMRAALGSVMAAKPNDEVLALALAKNALETGRWKSCHVWNFGNIKAGDKYAGMYTAFACNEVLAGKVVWFDPRGRLDRKGGNVVAERFDAEPWHPQTRFRAYANEFDGSFEYVDFVASGRYATAWKALLTGDARAFVHQLKIASYFTADETAYANGVLSLQREFWAKLRGLSPDPAHVEWSTAEASARNDAGWDRLTAALRDDLDLTRRDDDENESKQPSDPDNVA